ncbi:hypothetical protein CTHT_0000530, partial [Thermochaetoides thermophila DSM 1495]
KVELCLSEEEKTASLIGCWIKI